MEYKQHRINLSKEDLTFEEGCNRYIDYCKYRNLREGTINHYKQSFLNFYSHVEMMGLIGMGNNPMVDATVAVAVSVAQALAK